MFSMIPCSSDCIYQVDGYCTLETPTIVTNISNHGCVHRIQVKKKTVSILDKPYCFKDRKFDEEAWAKINEK